MCTIIIGLSPAISIRAESLVSVKNNTIGSEDRIDRNESDNAHTALTKYPDLDDVRANGVADNRITVDTTTIRMTISGTMEAAAPIRSYYFDILDKDCQSVSKGSPIIHNVRNQSKVTITGVLGSLTQSFQVDLKKLKSDTPVYAAVVFNSATEPDVMNHFSLAKFSSVTLSPKITNALTQASDTIIGTGQAGNRISSPVTQNTTTVKPDGTFALSIGNTALNRLNSVKISESNDNGDYGTDTAAVANPITIKIGNPNLVIDEKEAATLGNTYDSVLLPQLVQRGQITAKDSINTSDRLAFHTDMTDIGQKILQAPYNQPLAITIYASEDDSKSPTVTLNLTKTGGLALASYSPELNFSHLKVPPIEKQFDPDAAPVFTVTDHRATGNHWYLYATAQPLTVAGQVSSAVSLAYKNGDQLQPLTNASRLIAQGDSNGNGTPVTVTDKNVLLDVQPSVRAADYLGTINWNLQDTPAA